MTSQFVHESSNRPSEQCKYLSHPIIALYPIYRSTLVIIHLNAPIAPIVYFIEYLTPRVVHDIVWSIDGYVFHERYNFQQGGGRLMLPWLQIIEESRVGGMDARVQDDLDVELKNASDVGGTRRPLNEHAPRGERTKGCQLVA